MHVGRLNRTAEASAYWRLSQCDHSMSDPFSLQPNHLVVFPRLCSPASMRRLPLAFLCSALLGCALASAASSHSKASSVMDASNRDDLDHSERWQGEGRGGEGRGDEHDELDVAGILGRARSGAGTGVAIWVESMHAFNHTRIPLKLAVGQCPASLPSSSWPGCQPQAAELARLDAPPCPLRPCRRKRQQPGGGQRCDSACRPAQPGSNRPGGESGIHRATAPHHFCMLI